MAKGDAQSSNQIGGSASALNQGRLADNMNNPQFQGMPSIGSSPQNMPINSSAGQFGGQRMGMPVAGVARMNPNMQQQSPLGMLSGSLGGGAQQAPSVGNQQTSNIQMPAAQRFGGMQPNNNLMQMLQQMMKEQPLSSRWQPEPYDPTKAIIG